MSATFSPCRAADTAALVPAMPPPTTTKSNSPPSSGTSESPSAERRNLASASAVFGGWNEASALNTMASQRPSNPVRSCSASFASVPGDPGFSLETLVYVRSASATAANTAVA